MTELFSTDGLLVKQVQLASLALQMGFDQKLTPHPALPLSGSGHVERAGIQFLSLRPEAPKIIMIISGTHGVEGPAGYDLQMDLLEKRVHEKLPDDLGLVFVVALNPWGWANGRRTDENNVDLNRNGCWHGPPDLPSLNPEINALANPDECDEEWYRRLAACLADPVATANLRRETFRGQYDNPEGIFYGGRKRAWSLKYLELFLHERLWETCQHLAVLDIHTGLGEFGEITLISPAKPGDETLIKRCKSWFGLNVVFPNSGQTEIINAVSSDFLAFLARCLPEAQVTALATEIGTEPFESSFPIFVAENWLFCHPGGTTDIAKALGPSTHVVRERFQEFWYPPCRVLPSDLCSQWSAATRAGFGPIFRTVVRGLAEF